MADETTNTTNTTNTTDDQAPRKDLGAQGQQDKLQGKLNQAVGSVQKNVGKAVGNEEMQAKGKGREMTGKAESGIGNVEKKVDDALS